jgi:hypothetical protein
LVAVTTCEGNAALDWDEMRPVGGSQNGSVAEGMVQSRTLARSRFASWSKTRGLGLGAFVRRVRLVPADAVCLTKYVVIELLIYRCSTPFSIMHTAATMVVSQTAKGVTYDKRWAMEDAVYSSRPRFIRFRSE